MRRAAAVSLLLLAAAPRAEGATYCVSALHGDDAGDGSRGRPFRTLKRATAHLQADDRLVVLPGRYDEPLVISASGAPGRPIEIVGEGRPLVEAEWDAIDVRGSYVRVTGFEAHSTGWGSAIGVGKHNHHVWIIDNVARDSGCGGVSAQYADYVVIERNVAFGNGRRAPWQCSGISIYHPEASDRRPGVHNEIRWNRSFDNENQFVDEAVSHSRGHTTDGNGVIFDDADHTEADGGDPYVQESVIEDNLVWDNGGRGIHVFHSANVAVLHNLAWRDLKDPKLQRPAGEISAAFSRNIRVLDNIVVARSGEAALFAGWNKAPNLFDHNLVSAKIPTLAVESASAFGPHNLEGDPGLTRPGPGPFADFSLRPGALALQAGVAVRIGPDGVLTVSQDLRDRAGPRPPPPHPDRENF